MPAQTKPPRAILKMDLTMSILMQGQSFAFHCSNPNATVYEKTVNDLISEWNDNVALAEKTYNRNDVLILTEGYVQNINKESKDSYYMLLSQDEDSGLFSTEELRVYFNDETLDSLMKLKKVIM